MTVARKRVLFLVPSLIAGGAQRVFSVLLRHLDRDRFEPHLALVQATGPYMADLPSDVVVHNLNISRVRYSLPSVIKVIRKVRPDTVLCTLGHMNLTSVLAQPFMPKGTRLILREAAIATSFLEEETSRPQLWKWFYRRFYRKADMIVCLSDSMVDDFVNQFGLPRQKLVRIYNPVDLERVRAMADEGGNPFTGPGPQLVAASRLCRQKGFDVLLDAMPAVLARLPQAHLTILGDGPLELSLKEQAAKLALGEAVSFLGFQYNPFPYLKHAGLFLLPSRYEGLPNIVLEALALGTRVIASDCPGGLREIQARHDRLTLVPPEDPYALADAVISLCNHARDTRRTPEPSVEALRDFDLQQVVEEYSKIF
jgi:glycosyltransferase involved in cell wall biosynthesis